MRNGGGLDVGGKVKKWSDLEYILMAMLIGFAGREAKDDLA